MTSLAILIDFGSTFTKVAAVDLSSSQLIGRSQAPSTVRTDVREGLLRALTEMHENCAVFARAPKDLSVLGGKIVLASSSAAGGLRIAVVGNVPGVGEHGLRLKLNRGQRQGKPQDRPPAEGSNFFHASVVRIRHWTIWIS